MDRIIWQTRPIVAAQYRKETKIGFKGVRNGPFLAFKIFQNIGQFNVKSISLWLTQGAFITDEWWDYN